MDCMVAVLFSLISLAVAYPRPPPYDYPPYPIDKPYYAPKPYDFGYETKDAYGGVQHRQESSDGHGGVKGSYGYIDPWGISRHVEYIADEHGYRAKVRTNEPGTANQDPADVLVDADPVPGPVGPVKKVVPLGPVGPVPGPVVGPPKIYGPPIRRPYGPRPPYGPRGPYGPRRPYGPVPVVKSVYY